MTQLSRDAQVVLLTFFSFGRVARMSYGPVGRLTARAQVAFDELEQHGMIEKIAPEKLKYGAHGYAATAFVGEPMRDYRRPTADDANWQVFEN